MSSTMFKALGCAFLLLNVVMATTNNSPRHKMWNKNTNLNNLDNWGGFERNCSQNIYDFPIQMERTVITISPNVTISTKQIILPRNGHLVFQKGATVWYNFPAEPCPGTELKFQRTFRADWFAFDNWDDSDSLLNSGAIPHVERVPCQYDSVQFPSESSFHLFISSDVVVAKFFLGEEELNYTTVAFLMTSQLGQIQFRKASETLFQVENVDWKDSDDFICKNYQPPIRSKICSLVKCPMVHDQQCGHRIIPHGFCCSICGYHLKIEHNGALALAPVKDRAKRQIQSMGLDGGPIQLYIGRYSQKLAHLVVIPWMNKTKDVGKLVDEIRIFLKSDPAVTSTTLIKSWEDTSSSSLESSESGAGLTVFIIFFVLFLICVTGILVFLWTKRGYPPLTFNSILARLPQLPGMGPSSSDSPRPSFSFSRFSNERVSHVNIGASISPDIQRTEEVDKETKPNELTVPPEFETSNELAFINATYDLIGIDDTEPPIPSTSTSAPSIPFREEDEHIYDLVTPASSAISQGLAFPEE